MPPEYQDEHEEILRNALVDSKLLSSTEKLPEPWDVKSGILGVSRLYLLSVQNNGNPLHLVAKFDSDERANNEWTAIEQLRKTQGPPEAILPRYENKREHGVVIYDYLPVYTKFGNVIDLFTLFKDQLGDNPTNCVDALDKLLEILSILHKREPGKLSGDAGKQISNWNDVFPRLNSRLAGITSRLETVLPTESWSSTHIQITRSIKPARKFPNPLHYVEYRLKDIPPNLFLSRVHGDLNLTNALVSITSNHAPDRVFLIDLANSLPDRPTATDYARLESEFWHEVFVPKATDDPVVAFTLIRDLLEGRDQRSLNDLHLSDVSRSAHKIVFTIRKAAAQVLSGGLSPYLFEDYFDALYFIELSSLAFKTVQEVHDKTTLALLGAALSQQVHDDILSGRYRDDPSLSSSKERLMTLESSGGDGLGKKPTAESPDDSERPISITIQILTKWRLVLTFTFTGLLAVGFMGWRPFFNPDPLPVPPATITSPVAPSQEFGLNCGTLPNLECARLNSFLILFVNRLTAADSDNQEQWGELWNSAIQAEEYIRVYTELTEEFYPDGITSPRLNFLFEGSDPSGITMSMSTTREDGINVTATLRIAEDLEPGKLISVTIDN